MTLSAPAVPRSGRITLLTIFFLLAMGFFLALRPAEYWPLLFLAALIGFGMDGVLRATAAEAVRGGLQTGPYLVLPVLYTVGAGLLLQDILSGYWTIPAAILATLVFGAVAYSEVLSSRPHDPLYVSARLILGVVAYVTASALFAVLYTLEVDVAPAAVLAGLIALLLSVEILREAEIDGGEMLVHATVIGLVVGEARWALYYMPVQGYLAGLALLLAFYLLTGLLRAHLVGHLTWWQGFEYLVVTATGIGVVVLSKTVGGG